MSFRIILYNTTEGQFVSEFFIQYGLFAAKSFTLIFMAIIGLIVFASVVSAKQKARETIEIEKINDHFEHLRDAIESEVFSKQEYKALQKERKKAEKQNEKKLKKQSKCHNDDNNEEHDNKQRLFLLRFDGDMHASEVDGLRESITAILTVAKPSDEVLVILDSPGGIVHNYGLAASQLQRIRQKSIHLTVAVDLVAASGGYMMACVANKIIAAPFAVVGSIGVLAQVPNFNRLLTKHDIDIEHHTAGEYKSTLTMLGKNSNKAREKFREELEDTHVLFKNFVSDNRTQLNIDQIATGEHWYGTQAIELQLIDEIKTSDDYLLEKAKHADIYEVSYQIHETFKEKLNSLIYQNCSKVFGRLWTKFLSPVNWKN